ncbi:MAG: EAL domain-containing protein [Hydrogenophaga sp.]|uniref:putative bifunctional diguanylate cyclase/phosphodiesterase n=1 Tax=Hydrogenophaga sp. TaxID=1904254 RepID=UPI00271FFF3B|nr:EAL domain-containing protein [Hydrogenophaga sp.]MDO9032811.1 EAL domain-containing protein [Hydrogenophaga sp.]
MNALVDHLAPPSRTPGTPHLLLVDDDARLRTSFRLLLAQPGREISEAASGEDALVALKAHDFDLVLLDIGLPGVSGLDVLRWVAKHRPQTSVMMVSGQRELEAAVRALRHGAVDFLRKPDDLDFLPERVEQTLLRLNLQRENAAMAARLAQSERLHRFLVESSPDIVYTLDELGRFVYINPRIESLLGYSRNHLLGSHYREIVHEDDAELARYVFAERRSDERASTNVELRLLCNPRAQPGRTRHLVTTVSAMGVYEDALEAGSTAEPAQQQQRRRRFIGSYGVVRDISERKRAEETISFQALHDQLTDLPNRRLFSTHLELALVQAERRGQLVGVMFIDLDRFKLVNDTYGHLQGDGLLRSVAQRLRACVRAGDTVARQGGDEFTVLLPDLVNVDDALPIAQKILAELERPFLIDDREFRATASVGIATYPRDGLTAEQLLRNADIAMYQVKSSGRNGGRMFSAEMNTGYAKRLVLEHDLRDAIAQGQFEAHYQPQVSMRQGRVVGVELLIRWRHPTLGLLLPGQFVALAEETGMICGLSDWVLETACRQLALWHGLGHRHLRMAVNLSPLELARTDIVDRVTAPLLRHALPAGALEVEITENLLLEDGASIVEKFEHLRAQGVRVAIDDFGTRYSSLNYLRRFPVDSLKIDQSFVRDLSPDSAESPIIQAIIGIARGFNLHVVAEGVESEHQLQTLQALGCDEMQGYLLGRPMSAQSLGALLTTPPQLPVPRDG